MKEFFEIKKDLNWINVTSPTSLDIAFLRRNFNFHPITLDELTRLSTRTKVDKYDHYLYIVNNFPVYNSEQKCSQQTEIDIVVEKNTFITVSYEKLEVVKEFQEFLLNEKERKEISQSYHLVCGLLSQINNYSLRQLFHIENRVNKIKEKLFHNQERELLEEISYVKRDLATFGIIVWSQRATLESLSKVAIKFWGEEVELYFSEILGTHWKIIHNYNQLKEALSDFEETNSQLLNYKINEVMKTFTVLAFITFPLMLLAAILSIDIFAQKIGELFGPLSFFLLFAGVLVIMIVAAIIFKKKKWL